MVPHLVLAFRAVTRDHLSAGGAVLRAVRSATGEVAPGEVVAVTGRSGSRLADGRDLMLYLLRRKDGGVSWRNGTLVDRGGGSGSSPPATGASAPPGPGAATRPARVPVRRDVAVGLGGRPARGGAPAARDT